MAATASAPPVAAHDLNGSTSHTNGDAGNAAAGPPSQRLSKNAKRRAKKKQERESKPAAAIAAETEKEEGEGAAAADAAPAAAEPSSSSSSSSVPDLSALAPPPDDDEAFGQFKHIFAKFSAFDATSQAPSNGDLSAVSGKGQVIYSDDEDLSDSAATDSDGEGGGAARNGAPLSKRKQKKLTRLTVAELKQLVRKPEVVEWSDVTASDPKLLVQMKSARNTVPVPPHWSQKRDYLQNKRGIEKPAYELPAYIADTGIGTMKDALREKEAEQTLKAKTRERVQPKMGKLEVDYQKLHDAFFRFQTKPVLSAYGETYYEGKEYETKFKERRPGDLSAELKEALSIPPLAPPPWLIAMQRYGPPPSYPHLPIPGLNAPIPDGAQWGFHPGGWGRPPMDEFGNPLFGDVLGYGQQQAQQAQQAAHAQQQQQQAQGQDAALALGEPAQHDLFGELDPEESEEEEDDDDDEGDEDEDDEEAGEDGGDAGEGLRDGTASTLPPGGLETPGGMQSVASTIPGGLETPDFLELRKQQARGTATPAPGGQGPQRSLYQVIPETAGDMRGFMGSERGYDLAAAGGAHAHAHGAVPVLGAEGPGGGVGSKRKAGGGGAGTVDVSFDPAELEGMGEKELQERYDAARRVGRGGGGGGAGVGGVGGGAGGGEDLSLLREELTRKRRIKEERRREKGGGGGRGEERFKF